MLRDLIKITGGIMMLLAISCSSCKTPENEIKRINLTTYTAEDQLQFGNNLTTTLAKYSDEFPILSPTENVEIYGYLRSLYYTLANTNMVENRSLFTWDVTIIADDSREMAFVAPGGQFYIYTGLLKYLKGEHELAIVMAHELYYCDSGLGIEVLQEQFSGEPFLLGDIYLGYDVPEVVDVIEGLRENQYSTTEVMQADVYAFRNICPFTYNAIGLKQFINRALTDGNIDWSEQRPNDENRLMELESSANACSNIEEDPTYADRYFSFTEKLP